MLWKKVLFLSVLLYVMVRFPWRVKTVSLCYPPFLPFLFFTRATQYNEHLLLLWMDDGIIVKRRRRRRSSNYGEEVDEVISLRHCSAAAAQSYDRIARRTLITRSCRFEISWHIRTISPIKSRQRKRQDFTCWSHTKRPLTPVGRNKRAFVILLSPIRVSPWKQEITTRYTQIDYSRPKSFTRKYD